MKKYKTVKQLIEKENTKNLKGKRVAFEGHGIINGLNRVHKEDTHKITGIEKNGRLLLKKYNGRKQSYMPESEFDQECILYNEEDWKEMSTY